MDANLMGSARQDAYIDQGAQRQPFASSDLGLRGFGAGASTRDLRSLPCVSSDGAVETQPLREISVDERDVSFVDGASRELLREPTMRTIVLRDDQKTGCARVEPVHDAGPFHARDSAQIVAVSEKCIHERSRRVAGRRMYDHTGGLVHDNDV
jgi:hypothetical protein